MPAGNLPGYGSKASPYPTVDPLQARGRKRANTHVRPTEGSARKLVKTTEDDAQGTKKGARTFRATLKKKISGIFKPSNSKKTQIDEQDARKSNQEQVNFQLAMAQQRAAEAQQSGSAHNPFYNGTHPDVHLPLVRSKQTRHSTSYNPFYQRPNSDVPTDSAGTQGSGHSSSYNPFYDEPNPDFRLSAAAAHAGFSLASNNPFYSRLNPDVQLQIATAQNSGHHCHKAQNLSEDWVFDSSPPILCNVLGTRDQGPNSGTEDKFRGSEFSEATRTGPAFHTSPMLMDKRPLNTQAVAAAEMKVPTPYPVLVPNNVSVAKRDYNPTFATKPSEHAMTTRQSIYAATQSNPHMGVTQQEVEQEKLESKEVKRMQSTQQVPRQKGRYYPILVPIKHSRRSAPRRVPNKESPRAQIKARLASLPPDEDAPSSCWSARDTRHIPQAHDPLVLGIPEDDPFIDDPFQSFPQRAWERKTWGPAKYSRIPTPGPAPVMAPILGGSLMSAKPKVSRWGSWTVSRILWDGAVVVFDNRGREMIFRTRNDY